MSIYCSNEKELLEKKEELEKKGYSFKDCEDFRYLFGVISEDIVKPVGKCEFCGSHINRMGIYAHGRKCEVCGKTIFLEYKKGDLISFFFRNDPEICRDLVLRYYDWEEDTNTLLCYKEIPEQTKRIQDKEVTEKALEEFKDSYSIVTRNVDGEDIEFYAFYYNLKSSMLEDEMKIDLKDCCSRGGTGLRKVRLVKVYEGKEYDEYNIFDELPIEETITLYKDWLYEKNAAEILKRSNVSTSASYYSGRGAILGDLNSDHLRQIYSLLVSFKGEDAGKNFIEMVKDIEVMSATDFINFFYILEKNKWVWDKKFLQRSNKGISVDSIGTAIGTFGSMMSGNGRRDETREIKAPFLSDHGIFLKSKYSDSLGIEMYQE